MEQQKSYYAIIPAPIRYDKDLIPNAKLMYGEITALSNQHGYCYANNQYFSKLYDKTEVSISKWISQLENKEFIFNFIYYVKNKNVGKKRIIFINDENIKNNIIAYLENNKNKIERMLEVIKEKFNNPAIVNKEKFNNLYEVIKEKFKYNNIINTNNKIITTYSSYKKPKGFNDNTLKILSNINSKNVFKKIMLPDDYKNKQLTNKIIDLDKMFNSLVNGVFEKFYHLDKKWFKENNIELKKMSYSMLQRLLNKALYRYNQMLNDSEYWPENKKKTTKDFKEFIYNFKEQKSWFLYCVYNEPKKLSNCLKTTIGNKIKNSLPAEVQKAGEVLYKDTYDVKSFWFFIKQIYEWHKEHNMKLLEYNYTICDECGGNYQRSAGSIQLFFNTYIRFVENRLTTPNMGNFGINNKTWDWFKNDCWQQEDPFSLDFTKRKNPYEQYEDATEDLYDLGEIEAVI